MHRRQRLLTVASFDAFERLFLSVERELNILAAGISKTVFDLITHRRKSMLHQLLSTRVPPIPPYRPTCFTELLQVRRHASRDKTVCARTMSDSVTQSPEARLY